MDINEFTYRLGEYALSTESYKKWREIHGRAFGDIFLSAFDGFAEAQLQLTAALIRISKRDFEGGLSLLLPLESLCVRDCDCYSLFYFIGLCFEFMEKETEMNKYYGKMQEHGEENLFLLAFHPYYRTAKFAHRKGDNAKALRYYGKALSIYAEKEEHRIKRQNIGQLSCDMATVYLNMGDSEQSRRYIEASIAANAEESPQRNYVLAVLCAAEGKREEAAAIAARLPDFMRSECERAIAAIGSIDLIS